MAVNLANYEHKVKDAVRTFWQTRTKSESDDNRAAVVQGKHLDGFVRLVRDVVVANGLAVSDLQVQSGSLHLPGYFRATKQWDLLVVHKGLLVAAFEFKSQLGPSFGNNFNNRCEEVLGSATDLWIAFREGAFGTSQKPFLGYLVLLEDCPKSQVVVRTTSPHFDIFPEFEKASYANRYRILCDKLMKERLYEAATLLLSSKSAATSGEYTEYGLRNFVAKLAAHVSAVAAMSD